MVFITKESKNKATAAIFNTKPYFSWNKLLAVKKYLSNEKPLFFCSLSRLSSAFQFLNCVRTVLIFLRLARISTVLRVVD
jgi:hypothetical protein